MDTSRSRIVIFVIAALRLRRRLAVRPHAAAGTCRLSACTHGIEYLFMAVVGGAGERWGRGDRRRPGDPAQPVAPGLAAAALRPCRQLEIVVFGLLLLLILVDGPRACGPAAATVPVKARGSSMLGAAGICQRARPARARCSTAR